MCKPWAENTDKAARGIDGTTDISGISDLDTEVCGWIADRLMTQDGSDTATKLANLEAVLGYVREVRGGLDAMGTGMEPQPAEAAAGFLKELRNGLATTLITLGLLEVSLRKSAHLPTVEPGEPKEVEASAPGGTEDAVLLHPPSKARPAEYMTCGQCGGFYKANAAEAHKCDQDFNDFWEQQLDVIHGKGGWIALDEPVEKEPLPLASPSVEISPALGVSPPVEVPPALGASPPVSAEPEIPASALGMRDGSKKHRVYVAVKRLLEENGPMHIDDMLQEVAGTGVFADVKDPRTNFANILSAFRSRGLVTSDYRGIYSLPKGKAAA